MSHFDEIPEQSEDVIARPIMWTLAISVLVVVTCGVVVWSLQSFDLRGGGRSNIESLELVPPAQPFSAPTQLEQQRAAERTELERWTWANRDSGLVLLPVDVAIDRYLEQRGAR